jgi:hypothetical protein
MCTRPDLFRPLSLGGPVAALSIPGKIVDRQREGENRHKVTDRVCVWGCRLQHTASAFSRHGLGVTPTRILSWLRCDSRGTTGGFFYLWSASYEQIKTFQKLSVKNNNNNNNNN